MFITKLAASASILARSNTLSDMITNMQAHIQLNKSYLPFETTQTNLIITEDKQNQVETILFSNGGTQNQTNLLN